MEWLTNNTIANMRGPDFLFFYGTMIVAAMIVGWWLIRSADTSDRELALSLPPDPDPYEVAYLRGGGAEVIRLAVFRLIQAHCLVASGSGDGTITRNKQHAVPPGMSNIEQEVYTHFAFPQKLGDVCKQLAPQIRDLCAPLESRLNSDGLLNTETVQARAQQVRLLLMAVVLGLGGYKLAVALSRGRTNVAFLVIMGIVGFVFARKVSRASRLSRRGKTYLKRLQAKLEGGKAAIHGVEGVGDANFALMVALFGFSLLAGTAYAGYMDTLTSRVPLASDGSGGCGAGGGCGGSSSGCGGGGGGCGGCGGGD